MNKPIFEYTSYICKTIQDALNLDSDGQVYAHSMSFDLDDFGALQSSKKTVECKDVNNTKYRITVEMI